MPVTPYNTGKIKIGCHYVPPQINYHTDLSDQWQSVFLGERRETHWGVWFYIMLVIGFVLGYWGFR